MCSKVGLNTLFMPSVGLGTLQCAPGEVEKAVEWALEAGVRLFDCAYFYQNEKEIGAVFNKFIKEGKLKREDLFVVTKLPNMAMHPEDVEPYFEKSRRDLGLDYIDLYLIHSPVGIVKDEETRFMKIFEGGKIKFEFDTDLVAIWREMEKLFDSGKCKSIGVSNFNSVQLNKVSEAARVPIAANQVEANLYFQQRKLRQTMDKWGIRGMAYGPLGSPGRVVPSAIQLTNLFDDSLVRELALKHQKTPAQILIRHLMQIGFTVIPKSTKQHRIAENFDVLDFALSDVDVSRLNALDKGTKARTFDMSFLPTDDDIQKIPENPLICKEDEY